MRLFLCVFVGCCFTENSQNTTHQPTHQPNNNQSTNNLSVGVVSGLRQLLEFGLFHGDPHPGNIFCLRDGRIAYVDFGNVAQLSDGNKAVLVDAVVHAVNEDYAEMAGDFIKLGFLAPGTDMKPIVPALEKIWRDSRGQSLADFNFRCVVFLLSLLVVGFLGGWRLPCVCSRLKWLTSSSSLSSPTQQNQTEPNQNKPTAR